MEIDKDFLPYIFNDDIIYVLSDADAIEDNVETEQIQPQKPKQASFEEPAVTVEKATPTEPSKIISPKVLVLLAQEPAEKEEVLLNNILKAVGLSEQEVDRIYEHPAKFNELKGTQLLLSFHTSYAPKSSYEINVLNGIQVIYAHDLSTLEQNISFKKALWGNLKKINL